MNRLTARGSSVSSGTTSPGSRARAPASIRLQSASSSSNRRSRPGSSIEVEAPSGFPRASETSTFTTAPMGAPSRCSGEDHDHSWGPLKPGERRPANASGSLSTVGPDTTPPDPQRRKRPNSGSNPLRRAGQPDPYGPPRQDPSSLPRQRPEPRQSRQPFSSLIPPQECRGRPR